MGGEIRDIYEINLRVYVCISSKRAKCQLMAVKETKWRPSPVLWVFIVISSILIFFLNVFQIQHNYNLMQPTIVFEQITPTPPITPKIDVDMTGFLVKTKGCRIPDMEPMDSTVKKFIFAEKLVVCNEAVPALVESNIDSLFVMKKALTAYGVNDTTLFSCCYRQFRRVDPKGSEADHEVQYDDDCVYFNDSVKVNASVEFVKVTCYHDKTALYKDFFSFVPLKAKNSDIVDARSKLNVLIYGIDSISRLNFHRQMPRTNAILKKIKAVELLGYNKVADNTFPNLIPVLTGLSEDELKKNCWPNITSHFDGCPFIWKRYSENGYTTAFGEDASWMGLFSYQKRGFKHQPTDYFSNTFDREAEKQIGNNHRLNVKQCLGARESYKVITDYAEKFIESMSLFRRPYFAFFWSSSLSHDFLNKPKLGDKFFEMFIARLHKKNLLNNTAFIFLSDHGMRWGDIRSTFQGRVEERLPFLHIYLPEWYRNDYPLTYSNLMWNARRLTTPFDLHRTLLDLFDPYALTRQFLHERQENETVRRDYSLFEAITPERTCENASISRHWCTCQTSVKVDTNNTVILEAANFTVHYINRLLVGYDDCVSLELDEVIHAHLRTHDKEIRTEDQSEEQYTLTLRTRPSEALFEVTVKRDVSKDGRSSYEIVGTISRINLYDICCSSSSCVISSKEISFCYTRGPILSQGNVLASKKSSY
ncbi:hypothetical protein Trydic_g5690 [Trypoxylus dichotomus]